MLLGAGRLGDFIGNPLGLIEREFVVWIDNSKEEIRAYWTVRGELPSDCSVITYNDGTVVERGSSSPKTFTAATAGVRPKLAAVVTAPDVSDSAYKPLGALKLANLVTPRIRFQHMPRGRYRIENPALTQYELYRGIGGEPDLDGNPWQTFTSLPFTTPALTAGFTYYFVLRLRNKHNLVSQNIDSWQLTIAGGGSAATNPSAPIEQSIAQAANGAARIRATYDYLSDEESVRGDTWAVWLTNTGVAPNPAVDPATYEEDMVFVDGEAKLDYTGGSNAHGATLKALVRVRKAGTPDVDSTNTAIMTATADAVGPAAPASSADFLGQSARQD